MQARDIMVAPVITTTPTTSIQELAKTLLDRRISAVPVVDSRGNLVGIISEGDLLHRVESGTERRESWWLRLLAEDDLLATNYAKEHAHKVGDVMTRDVISVAPETPLNEIAMILENHAIKRVPILENGQLVGIVSRANLMQAVASMRMRLEISPNDIKIRERLLAHLRAQPWAHTELLNVIVNDGVVDLWGFAYSDAERKAIRIAAETASGVRAVNDHLSVCPVGAEA